MLRNKSYKVVTLIVGGLDLILVLIVLVLIISIKRNIGLGVCYRLHP